ncbi:MAG: hypothetical protein HYZ10_09255 [Ignavibacteriales bacterium]|nr:hypothetical protein [Ignavibacteriales bacterium]
MKSITRNLAALLFLLFAVSSSCKEELKAIDSPLNDEALVVDKYWSKIIDVREKIKKAERENQLQGQLDLNRNLNQLILELNHALRECSKQYPAGESIRFEQEVANSNYLVQDVKVLGCRLNDEKMEIETFLTARVMVVANGKNTLHGILLDDRNKKLADVQFTFSNDFPEVNKALNVVAHPGSFNKIKNCVKIIFDNAS